MHRTRKVQTHAMKAFWSH